MSALAGYTFKQVMPYRGAGAATSVAVSPAAALPQTATGNLFVVTGSVVVFDIVGIISTVFGSTTPAKLSLGVTGNATALAAAMAAAASGSAAGDLLYLPATLGGVMPAPVSAKASNKTAAPLIVSATDITLTTDASNTGAVSWVCVWAPLENGAPGSVAAS